MRPLRFAFAIALITGLCCVRSALAPSAKVAPNLPAAIDVVWRFYDQEDTPPYVTLVTGRDLNCSKNDAFLVPMLGCVYGVTLTPSMCVVAYTGRPFHETSLAHELLHAHHLRHSIVDPYHNGPDWQPGGLLDQANIELAKAGF